VYTKEKEGERALIFPCSKIDLIVFDGWEVPSSVSVRTSPAGGIQAKLMLERVAGAVYNGYLHRVYSACITLLQENYKKTFSLLEIYKTMTGNSGAKLTKSIIEAILDALAVLASTKISVDASKDYQEKGAKKATFSGVLLEVEGVKASILELKSHSNPLLRFGNAPLFEYTSQKKQIQRIPMSVIHDPSNKTKESFTISTLILTRIYALRAGRINSVLNLDKIFKKLEPKEHERQKRRTKNTIKTILKHYKNKHFIYSFTKKTGKNNKIIGYKLTLEPPLKVLKKEVNLTDKRIIHLYAEKGISVPPNRNKCPPKSE